MEKVRIKEQEDKIEINSISTAAEKAILDKVEISFNSDFSV